MKYKRWDSENDTLVSQLWAEYNYRHSHIWRVVFQTTAAVVALSIVPYLDGANSAGYLRYLPLFIASALSWFALRRIKREFKLFHPVKEEYLSQTRDQNSGTGKSSFEKHTNLYLHFLLWGSIIHSLILVIALFCQWLHDILKLSINT